MTKARTRTVRVDSTTTHSLVRTRTTRKAKTRKRATPKRLAEKLRFIREHLGMSQGEIASALDVENRASISGYERGEREPPLPILLAYSKLVNISTDILIDDEYTVEDIETFKGTSKRKA